MENNFFESFDNNNLPFDTINIDLKLTINNNGDYEVYQQGFFMTKSSTIKELIKYFDSLKAEMLRRILKEGKLTNRYDMI